MAEGNKMSFGCLQASNILVVHNYYQIPGGEDAVVDNERKMLEKNGHKVVLYTRNNAELKKMNILQKIILPFSAIFSIKTYVDIKNIIKNERINVVHVHNTLTLISPAVYYAALSCKVPVVQTVHNFRLMCPGATFYRDGHICEDCVTNGLGCSVKYKCYRGSRLQTLLCVLNTQIHRLTGIYSKINYICLTEFNREKLIQLKQIKPDMVFVKPNYTEDVEEIVKEGNRVNQFIFAGRLDKLKGIDILLKAWAKMGSYAPRLIVCGTGPMEKWCREFISENNCNIELKGFLQNQETKKIISQSRALILPTQWYEGFPMVIAEAYSVGTPVICSDLGNAGDAVCEGITGCKFKFDSEESLINAVRRCKGMHMEARRTYEQKYSEGINYNRMISIYSRICG